MSPTRRTAAALLFAAGLPAFALADDVLRASDVVFMYQGTRETYETYGATVLAWGGTPTPDSLETARGIRWFGSVGMVTEFAAYHRRFPDRYEEGLCRDLDGQPVKVPWLVDHNSKGVPYWWCCSQQPLFREFLRARVVETLAAGAQGLHIDDHLGSAGGLWLGLCFCDRCLAGFRSYLAGLPGEVQAALGVSSPADFDFRAEARRWRAAAPAGQSRKVTDHPLWSHWSIYQCRAAAAGMQELRELAAQTVGHPVPVGANAGLLWPRHLADYRAIDLFTAETDHRASGRKPSDLPIFAYRLAEAMGRPYAATASGADWAFIKEHNLPGLVRGWIALSYAAGQRLMAPHHQWCHTPEKGTHWYDGPAERFAPLYRFVRTNAALLDGFRTYSDVAVVVPHRAFLKNSQRWFEVADRLATANLTYRVLLAGDEIVDHPLEDADLNASRYLLAPERGEFLGADLKRFETRARATGVFATVTETIAAVQPAISLPRPAQAAKIRLLARTKPGAAVIHLLNYDYDSTADDVKPAAEVELRIDWSTLGSAEPERVRWVTPDGETLSLACRGGLVTVPRLGLWGLLVAGEP